METQLWRAAQKLVNEGKGHLVKDLYIEYIKSQLTESQLSFIEDLPSLIDKMIADPSYNMNLKITYVINEARKIIKIIPEDQT